MLRRSIILVIISLIIVACAEEDPNLVNAPPQTESIRVRLLNFYSDDQGNTPSFKLVLDGKSETELTPNQMISPAIKPPADSSVVSIKNENGKEIFKASRKLRFSRGNFYSVIYSKAYFKDSTGTRLVDTTAFVATLANLPLKKDYSYIRLFNAVLDTLTTYSLKLGCPGGQLLGSARYLKSTPQQLVYADKNQPVSISITKTKNNVTTNVGLFTLPLEELKQYMIIIYKTNPNEDEKVYMFDEKDDGISLELLQAEIGELTSKIRMINFTGNNINFIKKTDSITQDLGTIAQFTISEFVEVPACAGNTQDTIFYLNGNDTIQTTTALEVKQNYTVFSFDSTDNAKKILIAEPYRIKTNGKASVRVLNIAYGKPNLTLSIAANSLDTSSNLRYTSGNLIADNSVAGTLSNPVLIHPGDNIPVTIFSAGEAAQLQYTTLMDLEPDRKYIIVVYWNKDDPVKDYQVFVIPDDMEDNLLIANDKGVFTQYVNLIPGFDYVNVTISDMLKNIKMYYSSSVATVLLPGMHNFTINGKDTTINIEPEKNFLFVFAGDESQTDFLVFINPLIPVEFNSYQRRFVNASKEIKLLNIKENKDDDNTAPIIEGLEYGQISKLEKKTLNKNVSFFFKNFQTGETVYRVDDLPFPFGKNYTIVFGGSSKDNSFSVVVVQEY